MRIRNIGPLLVVLNILLLTVCVVLYLEDDRKAPRITLKEVEYDYEIGMSEEILLEGVQAWDEKEGDVTNRVIIEKIVTDKKQNRAIITYGVADSAGNVSKASRNLVMLPVMVRPMYPAAGEGVIMR